MICERKRLLWACKRPVRRTDSLHISSSPHPDNNNKNDDNDSFICIALFNKGYKVLNSNKCLKKKKKDESVPHSVICNELNIKQVRVQVKENIN